MHADFQLAKPEGESKRMRASTDFILGVERR
jgi:hypothetical protein